MVTLRHCPAPHDQKLQETNLARLIPPQPRSDWSDAFLQALLTLEERLDDMHVIFQGGRSGLLILCAGQLPCQVIHGGEGASQQPISGLSEQPKQVSLASHGDAQRLLEAVRQVMRPTLSEKGVSAGEISDMIASVSPASPSYDGSVTPAQLAWRADQKLSQLSPRAPNLEPIVGLIRNTIEGLLGETPARLQDTEISASDIASPDGLLPAFLVASALRWAPIVSAKDGKGGFRTHLKRRSSAPCGYVVTRIEMSAPLLLVLPLIEALRSTYSGSEYVMDKLCEEFLLWMARHGHPVEDDEFVFDTSDNSET